jgi:hypothetical protein
MYRLRHSSRFVLLWVVAIAPVSTAAQEDFSGWNLEQGVAEAHLVMVARVTSISRVTVVEGAKTDVTLREYRFQPVRRLKGIFQRDELSMTASDLGCSADLGPSAPELKEGEFRLLILAQQSGRSFGGLQSFGCVSMASGVTSFAQRVPLLSGPDDPLVGVVETLIKVADSRSRRERATLLIDRLEQAEGLAAVPLLTSLQLRADWAAADGRAYDPLARLALRPLDAVGTKALEVHRDDVHPREVRAAAIRGAALNVLRDMLASRIVPDDAEQLAVVADALREILESDEANSSARVAALEALGHLLAIKNDFDWPRELLTEQLNGAATNAERAAAVTALANIAHPNAVESVLGALAALPLDEADYRELIYVRAAYHADAAGAERVLLARLEQSLAARDSIGPEVAALGSIRGQDSLPLLLAAAAQPNLPQRDRYAVTWALGLLGDDRAVPVLVDWMRGEDFGLKEFALRALEDIDSETAAREARPLLKPESYLPFKLRLARLLARHGIDDGYSLATEHLADDDHTAAAALVLAALDDPRTPEELSAILDASPDRRWHAAALTGLAAVGDAESQNQLLSVLADDRDPLAADAAEAAGLADGDKFLLPLAELAQSRNKTIAMASLRALRRRLRGVRSAPRGLNAIFSEDYDLELNLDVPEADKDASRRPADDLPAEARTAIAEVVAALAVDAYVDGDVRNEALSVAQRLGGEDYAELLAEMADQAELEGSALLTWAQAERLRLRGERR